MRLSELIGREVVDETGRRFGKVFDVRASATGDEPPVLVGLVVGRGGLVERVFGSRMAGERLLSPLPIVPWAHVVRVERETVVVRGGTALRADTTANTQEEREEET